MPVVTEENLKAWSKEIRELKADIAKLNEYAKDDIFKIEDLANELDELREELARVQRLPELDWVRVTLLIAQEAAKAARAGYQGEGKAIVAAMDMGMTYVNRILARVEKAEKSLFKRVSICDNCPCLVFDPKIGKPCVAEIKKLRGMVEDRDRQIAMMCEKMDKQPPTGEEVK